MPKIICIVLAIILTSCTYGVSPWIRDPAREVHAYHHDRYTCLHDAWNDGYGGFVAVTLSTAIYMRAQQQHLYKACMQRQGWYLIKPYEQRKAEIRDAARR